MKDGRNGRGRKELEAGGKGQDGWRLVWPEDRAHEDCGVFSGRIAVVHVLEVRRRAGDGVAIFVILAVIMVISKGEGEVRGADVGVLLVHFFGSLVCFFRRS